MIDVHCHLEQKDYDSDREEVIAVISKEYAKTLNKIE